MKRQGSSFRAIVREIIKPFKKYGARAENFLNMTECDAQACCFPLLNGGITINLFFNDESVDMVVTTNVEIKRRSFAIANPEFFNIINKSVIEILSRYYTPHDLERFFKSKKKKSKYAWKFFLDHIYNKRPPWILK
jgi:hypothetical protein